MSESSLFLPALDVLMATTSFPRDATDWKGRFIHDLAAALDRTGEVRISLWGPPGALPGQVTAANSSGDAAWLDRLADRGGVAHLLRNHPLSGLLYARGILSRLRDACLRDPPQIYHVNWLQLALYLPDDRLPAYVSILGSDFGLLRLPGMTRLLRRAFSKRRTLLAPNADWMTSALTKKFGDVAEITTNPFGVSQSWFDIERRPAAHPEWLVVSRVTRNKLGDLIAWGDGLFTSDRRLRLLGPMQERLELPDWVVYEGHTSPDELRESWFPQAAGLLTLSRHDEGRPQVVIEAMAGGLPVIASRIPAHEDLIQHNETGWLVDSQQELADALQHAETPADAGKVGSNARDWIHDHIGTWDDSAKRCIAGYHDLVARESSHAGQ
jgi:glycosyltransferase involved in cell wall biosynthesis